MNIDLRKTNSILILAHRRYLNSPRVVRHYNNVIASNEKNCYKIVRDRTGRNERADRQPSEASRRGLESDQWPPPRQLPFRWKCDGCPLFCMIKYRRKKRLGKPDQPPYIPFVAPCPKRRAGAVPTEKSVHVAPNAREPY